MSHGLGEGDECQTSALNGLEGEGKAETRCTPMFHFTNR